MTPEVRATLVSVREIPTYAVIIRCIHCRGTDQAQALAELAARGCWLTEDQKREAGIL